MLEGDTLKFETAEHEHLHMPALCESQKPGSAHCMKWRQCWCMLKSTVLPLAVFCSVNRTGQQLVLHAMIAIKPVPVQ
jgi:hypothetical protein